MPSKKNNKKSKKSKNQNKNKKKSKSTSYDIWWILSFIVVGIISIAIYFYVDNNGLSASLLGQPKTPAKKQQLDKLSTAINNLQFDKIKSLVFEYQYDFKNIDYSNTRNNHQLTYPKLDKIISQFFQEWSEKINDNQYKLRQDILELLIKNTNIQDHTQLCLCNHAIKYRLIDASKLIMPSMSSSSINGCFSHKTQHTNNTVFHAVTKSRSASFARLMLKLGKNNPKLKLSADRLYLDIPRTYSNSKNSVVFQSDIKKMQSSDDIDIVLSSANRAKMKSDWFYAKNSENYTGYDYWILNQGLNKEIKKKNIKRRKKIAQSVTLQDCNFNEEILFDNSCYPSIIYNWDDFDIYWKEQRPVIIKNGLLNTNDVTFDSLIENYGDLSVMVSEIPYATLFGQKAWSIPIKEYNNGIMNGPHQSNLYAFDKTLISTNVALQNFFNFSIPYMTDDAIRIFYQKTWQLALGPINSGSPPHWHQPAFNGLYVGRKMWWMFSPKTSMYSSMNIVNWINNEYKQKMIENGEVHRHYCFIQEAGDIVFVPQEWAHAVSNLQPSLAVAIEYDI